MFSALTGPQAIAIHPVGAPASLCQDVQAAQRHKSKLFGGMHAKSIW
jgi:hypothetical protein